MLTRVGALTPLAYVPAGQVARFRGELRDAADLGVEEDRYSD
jgi:hypothetical protein